MSDYFELLEDEEQYKNILIEGAAKTGVAAGLGAMVARGAATKYAAKTGMKNPEKFLNKATAYGAGAGALASNRKNIKRAILAKQADKELSRGDRLDEQDYVNEILDEWRSALGAAAGGYGAYKLSGKTKKPLKPGQRAAAAVGGALAGAVLGKAAERQRKKDIEMKKGYKDRMVMKKRMQQRAQQAMKQRTQKYTESEELFEDTFAKITARSVGKYAGKAKDASNAAKKAKDRAAAFAKAMKRWKKEGH
jgi:hypothetical protein